MEDKKSFFDAIDGKTGFGVGFIVAILVIGTIGFIALGSKVLRGGLSFNDNGGAFAVNDPNPSQPSQPAQPSQPSAPVKVDVGHFPLRGNAKAKVTVIEFADFRCPFCERFYTASEKPLIKEYVDSGKAKLAFRSFAFLGPASTAASEAAECANDQGQFWKFHDWMYDHQADESNTEYYSNDNLIKYATDLGLNKDKFSSCLTSHKFAAQVAADLNDGQNAGVNGTPTTFVNGTPIVGAVPYAQVKAAIDQALAGS